VLQEMILSIEDSSDTIGNRTRIPPLCFKVKMSVMTTDILLDDLFTVFLESCCEFSVDM
jgi:hypothetical protein